MVEGRVEENWRHTAEILAMLYNANRDPKRTRPASGADFNPCILRKRKSTTLPKVNVGVLRDIFVGKPKKEDTR